MRRLAIFVLVVALVATACSGADAESPETTTTAETAQTTTSPTSTATSTSTTTTIMPSTTTTTEAVLVQPAPGDLATYAILASVTLGTSKYSNDAMGNDWAPMLRDGAIAACYAFADGLPLEEVMRSALAAVDVTEYSSDEFTLVLTLTSSGPPYYCPDHAMTGTDDQKANAFVAAWSVLGDIAPGPVEAFINNGTWTVGNDIEPGTYRTTGGDSCYWERLSGFGGTTDDIIASGFSDDGPVIVTIDAADAGFSSTGCALWVKQ